jgi:hypothetical protein
LSFLTLTCARCALEDSMYKTPRLIDRGNLSERTLEVFPVIFTPEEIQKDNERTGTSL